MILFIFSMEDLLECKAECNIRVSEFIEFYDYFVKQIKEMFNGDVKHLIISKDNKLTQQTKKIN